jgi:H+/Cl- antiporter ClcA
MACCIAHQLATRISYFKDVATEQILRIQFYTAAICTGAMVTWSTPIGGLMLGIELTSTYFMIGTFMKSCLATVFGITCLYLMYNLPSVKPALHTDYEPYELNHEISFFIILGFLSSRIAIMFNHVLTKIIFLRVKLKNPFISNRWKWCTMVTLFISFITFPIPFFHLSEKQVFNELFSSHDL